VERKETAMVESRAVMSRTRMRAEPEEEELTTIERRGRREMEQSQIGPKGEGVGTTESKCTERKVNLLALLRIERFLDFMERRD
jgi:hypothetical protein